MTLVVAHKNIGPDSDEGSAGGSVFSVVVQRTIGTVRYVRRMGTRGVDVLGTLYAQYQQVRAYTDQDWLKGMAEVTAEERRPGTTYLTSCELTLAYNLLVAQVGFMTKRKPGMRAEINAMAGGDFSSEEAQRFLAQVSVVVEEYSRMGQRTTTSSYSPAAIAQAAARTFCQHNLFFSVQ